MLTQNECKMQSLAGNVHLAIEIEIDSKIDRLFLMIVLPYFFKKKKAAAYISKFCCFGRFHPYTFLKSFEESILPLLQLIFSPDYKSHCQNIHLQSLTVYKFPPLSFSIALILLSKTRSNSISLPMSHTTLWM